MKKSVVLFILLGLSISASAGIMIHPKFLFFDDKTKVEEIILINSDPVESANYRISLSYKKQNQDGSYTEIVVPENDKQETPKDSAVPFLRYSPRAAFLSPQKSQIVRILKRLPEGLEPGDYIAYITFTEVLMEKPLTKEVQKNTFSVKITPIPSFSIPILVRYQNKENPKVSLEVLEREYKGPTPYITLRISKDKNFFVRGDISIWLKNEMIGFIKGKYLLPSNNSVDISIPLKSEEKTLTWEDLKDKKIKVLFTEPGEGKVNKKDVLAKEEINF